MIDRFKHRNYTSADAQHVEFILSRRVLIPLFGKVRVSASPAFVRLICDGAALMLGLTVAGFAVVCVRWTWHEVATFGHHYQLPVYDTFWCHAMVVAWVIWTLTAWAREPYEQRIAQVKKSIRPLSTGQLEELELLAMSHGPVREAVLSWLADGRTFRYRDLIAARRYEREAIARANEAAEQTKAKTEEAVDWRTAMRERLFDPTLPERAHD